MKKESGRKVRSDKKVDVKPTIAIELKDAIYELSYITRTPVKDVCAEMVRYMMNDSEYIERLSEFFLRNVRLNNTVYIGRRTNNKMRVWQDFEKERIMLRLTLPQYEILERLAFALGIRPTTACGLILDAGMRSRNFVIYYEANFSQRK